MKRVHPHTSLRRVFPIRQSNHICEALESRTLLSGDPVIVLTEQLSLEQWTTVNSGTVTPKLWTSDSEFAWNLERGNYDTEHDYDGNGYKGDAYGWNFLDGANGSPNFINNNNELGGHCATIVSKLLPILNDTGLPADRVRIMFVVGTSAQIVGYVRLQKDHGVNIVAVDGNNLHNFTRADALALQEKDILLFGPFDNANFNDDSEASNPGSSAFYHATPRGGTGEAPVDTVIPVTTDPAIFKANYGINSYLFAVGVVDAQSWSNPIAALYAAIAVQAYQAGTTHLGVTPTPLQLKRAMMSGVIYKYYSEPTYNDLRTVTHDFVSGSRAGMGVLDLDSIIDSLDHSIEITGVEMDATPIDSLGNKVSASFTHTDTNSVDNWTISWGDNSGSDQSGVNVINGALSSSAVHTFPFSNVQHYFPTIYAMSASKQVYLQASQLDFVNETWAPTSGQDDYTLSRTGGISNPVELKLVHGGTTTTATFAPGDLPTAFFKLGAGNDTLTIDFTNGNPLQSMSLNVTGTPGANNVVRIIGAANNTTSETFDVAGGLVTTHGSTFLNQNVSLYIDGRDGNDTLTLVGGKHAGPTVHLDSSQSFTSVSIDKFCTLIVDQNGTRVLQTKALSIDTNTASLDLNDNDLIVDYTGTSVAAAIQGLINSARNGGNWDGTSGITSTSAKGASPKNTTLGLLEATEYQAMNGNPSTWDGVAIDSTAVLVKYTYYGDTDFNGLINFDDYSRTDAGFNNNRSGWMNGDFNANGVVNFDDYSLIDLAFNTQNNVLLTGPGGGDPNLIALGQMEHFTESYMWFFIDWNIQNRGVYYTPEDFFPDGVPW